MQVLKESTVLVTIKSLLLNYTNVNVSVQEPKEIVIITAYTVNKANVNESAEGT